MNEQKTDEPSRCAEQQPVLLFRYHGTLWVRCRMRKDMPGENGGTVRAGRWGYRSRLPIPAGSGRRNTERL